MRIGYACKVAGEPSLKMRSCILKNASQTNLQNIISHNLNILSDILDYNKRCGISMFRISSDIIPFASHPLFSLNWKSLFADKLIELGRKAQERDIRLSMHAGQYTIINSPNEDLLQRSIADLAYHADFLDSLCLPPSHKVVIHVGGAYGNKQQSLFRFVKNFSLLPQNVRDRLVIENDERLFTVSDCYEISKSTGLPIVFDYFHHTLNPSFNQFSIHEIVNLCKSTWQKRDGSAKVHYSQQLEGGHRGAHSKTIELSPFMKFVKELPKDVDIMLEVKDKDLSAIKCIGALNCFGNINNI